MRKQATLRLAMGVCLLFGMAGISAAVGAPDKLKILILCTGNSARSQMTEGVLRSLNPKLDVHSAGTKPAPKVNPFAVQAMKEIGLDISAAKPKAVEQYIGQDFDFVVTVCDDADKNCPRFSGKVGKRLHIGFPDPAKATGTDAEKLAVFRKVRDDIRTRFGALYQSELSPALAGAKLKTNQQMIEKERSK